MDWASCTGVTKITCNCVHVFMDSKGAKNLSAEYKIDGQILSRAYGSRSHDPLSEVPVWGRESCSAVGHFEATDAMAGGSAHAPSAHPAYPVLELERGGWAFSTSSGEDQSRSHTGSQKQRHTPRSFPSQTCPQSCHGLMSAK